MPALERCFFKVNNRLSLKAKGYVKRYPDTVGLGQRSQTTRGSGIHAPIPGWWPFVKHSNTNIATMGWGALAAMVWAVPPLCLCALKLPPPLAPPNDSMYIYIALSYIETMLGTHVKGRGLAGPCKHSTQSRHQMVKPVANCRA